MSRLNHKINNIEDYFDNKGKWRFDKSEIVKNRRKNEENMRKLSKPVDTRTELQRIFAKS